LDKRITWTSLNRSRFSSFSFLSFFSLFISFFFLYLALIVKWKVYIASYTPKHRDYIILYTKSKKNFSKITMIDSAWMYLSAGEVHKLRYFIIGFVLLWPCGFCFFACVFLFLRSKFNIYIFTFLQHRNVCIYAELVYFLSYIINFLCGLFISIMLFFCTPRCYFILPIMIFDELVSWIRFQSSDYLFLTKMINLMRENYLQKYCNFV
jgi:hypothetical protein